jgi:hypothetical protein
MLVLSGGAFANQMLVHATWAKLAREKRGERGLDAPGEKQKKNIHALIVFCTGDSLCCGIIFHSGDENAWWGFFLLDFYQILLFYSSASESLGGNRRICINIIKSPISKLCSSF